MYWARVTICALLMSALSTAVTFSNTAYGANQSPNSAITGDFDKDGRPDFAVMEAGNMLTIYLNVGSGKFSQKARYAVATNNNNAKIDTADMDSDGKLDLVIGKQYVPEFEIWFGNGDGTFRFGKDVSTVSPDAFDFVLADINHDGNVDFFNVYVDDTNSTASTYFNDGSANFTHVFGPSLDSLISNYELADFDRDGQFDILMRDHNQLNEYSGNGTGTFTLHATSTVIGGSASMTKGSFNRDSSLDVAVRVWNCGSCTASSRSKVYIYLNDGIGHFGLRSSYTAGVGPGDITAGNLNGDGIEDILLPGHDIVNGTNVALQYLLNQGDGHFNAPLSAGSFSRQDNPVVRDLNRDGRHDLVFPAGSTYVMLNTNAAVMCTPTGSAALSARICGPADGASVSRTFTVSAGGNSPAGVTLMQLYVDGKKSFELWNDQLKRTITVAAARHRVVVIAVDRFGKTVSKVINVTAH